MQNPTNSEFNSIALSIASPDQILSWSHGEIKNPETINYRTQKPEREGLFCERIFGPTKNYECYCGKYKRIRYKGVICEKCGVEVTRSNVRRQRMGHIKLAVPIVHIWYLRSSPSRIGLLLDIPVKTIEQVIYFAAYIVTSVDEASKKEALENLEAEYSEHKKTIKSTFLTQGKEAAKSGDKETAAKIEAEGASRLDELTEQFSHAKSQLQSLTIATVLSELEYRDLSMKFGHIFSAGIGAEAIREIIGNIDLNKLIEEESERLNKTSGQKQKKLIKRIKLAGSLLKAEIKAEWMVLKVLPVIPPDLRPMVQLDGGRFAASDLNDLYRRVINRNNRLKRLMSIGAPEVICRNEKRMLQEAVDALINNSARQSRSGFNAGDKRKLRSLSDMLKGKQGRFRQNLLGKRVDYSGRSVIVVGPKLKLNQCGLPKKIALELFKPFVIGRLISDGYAYNIKNAEKLITQSQREVWDILEEITAKNHVLLNRAPTLHRLGIQAFKPVLIEGKAIQIHPLVCAAFNADFDGDQMAVHLPLSRAAQKEAAELIASNKNLLKPSAGDPIVTPSQDIILGVYYLTKVTAEEKGAGMAFASEEEAIVAYKLDCCHIQAPIKCKVNGELIETTIGKLIFNQIVPEELPFYNQVVTKKVLSKLIYNSYEIAGEDKTAKFADEMKDIGFKYATLSGVSIGINDMTIPDNKEEIVKKATQKVKDINLLYNQGFVTDEERYTHIIKIWSKVKGEITKLVTANVSENNDISYMISSGARGNWGQLTQMCGMKGLVANPGGKTIELPIKSSLKEGFTILEYFIATHGGRKGKSDTALKTAEAGYLTRRLVDAVQDVIIKEIDCNTPYFNIVTRDESEIMGETFEERIFGRTLSSPIKSAKSKKVLVAGLSEVDESVIEIIHQEKITEVKVRSILTCQIQNGICQKCYGRDLGNNKIVDIGTAVGIIAAQSIGEPGTQLTMRTFHMGGIADGDDITQGLTRVEELFEARSPKNCAILSEIPGKVKIHHKAKKTSIEITSEDVLIQKYKIPTNTEIIVKPKQVIKANEVLAKGKTLKSSIICDVNGKIISIDNDIVQVKTDSVISKEYEIPHGKILKVKNNHIVERGTPLTSGHINLHELVDLTSFYQAQRYVVEEIQSIYSSQGQTINDKHVEIIVRQMCSKVRTESPGDSNTLPGEVIDYIKFENMNNSLKEDKKQPAKGERLLLGLTRISLLTNSWLSAASFQETIRVLVEASTTRKIDVLSGLKENVIIGKLIPAGAIYKNRHENFKKNEENLDLTGATASEASDISE